MKSAQNQVVLRISSDIKEHHYYSKHHTKYNDKIIAANDETVVIDVNKPLGDIKFYLGATCILLLAAFIMKLLIPNGDLIILISVFTFPFLIFLLYHLLIYAVVGKKYIVLNRKEGTISYPKLFIYKSLVTVPFKELKILEVDVYSDIAYQTGSYFKIRSPKGNRIGNGNWNLRSTADYGFRSYMVWYMDKNRPLPPGDALDAYREKDYQRRRAEGFKKPLFESSIITPEHIYEYERYRKELAIPKIWMKPNYDEFYNFKFKNDHQITNDELIFDRQKGVILLVGTKSEGKMKGYYFSDLRFDMKNHFVYKQKGDCHYLITNTKLNFLCDKGILSLFTWYMDKNRPLLPIEGFDRIRRQDYERRKAEGFPKPLYPSNFETPEATPEQQKERERIGGW